MPGRSAPAGPGLGDACWARREFAHLLELLARGQLLGEQGGLDAVEQSFEPPDELGLGDAEFALARDRVVVERQRQHVQLLLEVGRQRLDSSMTDRS